MFCVVSEYCDLKHGLQAKGQHLCAHSYTHTHTHTHTRPRPGEEPGRFITFAILIAHN